jgi:hypothetical protein
MQAGCGVLGDAGAEDPVAEDSDILLVADVEEVTGYDDVTLVELTDVANAPYQAAFERESGGRLAIITIQDAEDYPSIFDSVDGGSVDIGDEAVAKGAAVYFRKGARAVTIYAVVIPIDGEMRPALSRDDILELARTAADRS